MAFSPGPGVRALPGGQLSSGEESTGRSGSQLCLLAEDEGPMGHCPISYVASAVGLPSCTDCSLRDPGEKIAISPGPGIRDLSGGQLEQLEKKRRSRGYKLKRKK
jgi:hypothetical protein